MIFRSSLLILLPAAALLAQQAERPWKDTQGRVIQAAYVSSTADSVTIRLADGKQHTLPLARLSADDQAFVKSQSTTPAAAPKVAGSAAVDPARVPILQRMGSESSLTNHLLVAMPSLADPNFAQTVTLICEHSIERGALGIVVNKPLPMKLADVLSQMKLDPRDDSIGERPVLRGGPVHTDRGFVLHRPGGNWDSSHQVSGLIQVTTSRDVLAAMAGGEGPEDAFIALGYAGWESGQLEREMLDNAWLSIPADENIVFELPYEDRWPAVWRLLGVDLEKMTPFAGHA